MEYIVPVAGFVFIISGLTALQRVKRDQDWSDVGILAALSFAVMMFFVTAFASNR